MKTIVMLFLALAVVTKAQADALDTWIRVGSFSYGDFNQVAFGNGEFMAVSSHAYPPPYLSGTATSSDGFHWVNMGLSSSSTFVFDGVAFGNGTFVRSVSLGDGGEIFWNSATNNGIVDTTQLNCVTFGNGIFVAAGFDYEGGDFGAACVQTNGQPWPLQIQDTMIASGFYPNAIAYGFNGFVATGFTYGNFTNTRVYYSPDGHTWTDESPYAPVLFNGISFVNGLFTALGADGNYYTCPDVANDDWTEVGARAANIYVPTSGTNSIYVNVGTNGGVYTSSDRVHWTQRVTGITNNLTCIAYGDNRFVVAGAAGGIFVSGSTVPVLTVQNQSPAGVQLSLTGGLGPTYHLQASTDLSNWTNLTVFTNIGAGTNYLDTTASNFTQRYYRTISP